MINVKITDMNTGLPSVSREAQEVVKMFEDRIATMNAETESTPIGT